MHHDLSEGKVLSLHKSSFSFLFLRQHEAMAAASGATVVVGRGEKIKQQIFGRNLAYSANADVRILKQEPSRAGLIFLHLVRFKMHDGSNQ